MAPQLKEVVVNADLIELEDFSPNFSEDLLHRSSRGGVGIVQLGSAVIESWQRFAVELAVGGERQRIEEHKGRGHHVVGELLLEKSAQVVGRRVGADSGDGIGDEAVVSRCVFSCEHHRLLDRGVLDEHGFDLTQLDAEAADLDLIVDAAEQLDVAVG